MKVYLHYENGKMGPTFTTVAVVDENSTTEGILEFFTRQYNVKFSSSMVPSALRLQDGNGKIIKSFYRCVNRDDIFVIDGESGHTVSFDSSAKSTIVQSAKSTTTVHSTKPAPIVQSNEQNKKEGTREPEVVKDSIVSTAISNTTTSIDYDNVEVDALKFYSSKQYKKAKDLCERFADDSRCYRRGTLLQLLAEMNITWGKYDVAIAYAEKLVGLVQNDVHATFLLAKAHKEAGELQDAEKTLLRAAKIAKAVPAKSKDFDKTLILEIEAMRAECVFAQGRHVDAGAIINELLSSPLAEKHPPTLLAYASFAFTFNKFEEAVRGLLISVTVDQKSKRIRQLLARVLATEQGFAELMKQVQPTTDSAAAAFAFLSTITRDSSALEASVKLMTHATRLQPHVPNHALSLAHLFENICEASRAVDTIVLFFKANTQRGVATGQYLTPAAFLAACAPLLLTDKDGGGGGSNGKSKGKKAKLTSSGAGAVSTEGPEDPVSVPTPVPVPERLQVLRWVDEKDEVTGDTGHVHVEDFASPDGGPSPDVGPSGHPLTVGRVAQKYDDSALDVLALGFTLIKVLYAEGRLSALPALYAVVEPARRLSDKALHLTTVRNEHAYYYCIAQVLSCRRTSSALMSLIAPQTPAMPQHGDEYEVEPASRKGLSSASSVSTDTPGKRDSIVEFSEPSPLLSPPLGADGTPGDADLAEHLARVAMSDPLTSPAFAEAARSPIYVCGDSHVIPLAWSVVRTGGGRPRLLVPKLVTGVKHWHLRPESDFYPKAQFFNVVQSIPDGADVIFVVGEIDCREGLLVALERGHYSSLAEGMQRTVGIFVDVLNQLRKKRKFNIFVHPVLPILPETRGNVVAYNGIYKKAITERVRGAVWLDFFNDLFVPGTTDLRPEYRLDGTHANPSYITLVERTLMLALS